MPTLTATDYLSPATLASIGSLELRARSIVEGLMTGMHRSPYQGFSVEFAQHRQYAPGDDLRRLDWKVFGRTDKLYLKQYQQETNLDLLILVDTSGSMAYASERTYTSESPPAPAGGSSPWRKYDHAASLAAALSFLALRQLDRVGLVMFDDTVHVATRMSNAHEHWRTIVDALATHQLRIADPNDAPVAPEATRGLASISAPGRTTDLSRLFDQILAKLTQRSLIVLLSDLFDDPEQYEKSLARISHRRHDLIVLQVMDHAELTFPFRAPGEFFGLEGEPRLRVDPAALRKAYLESMQAHLTRVEELTRRFRYDHLLLDSSQSLGAPLSHFLARRAASVGRKG